MPAPKRPEDLLHEAAERGRVSFAIRRRRLQTGLRSVLETAGRAAERVPHPGRRGKHRPSVLEQSGDVGGEGRDQREKQSEDHESRRAETPLTAANHGRPGG